jgi:hypothetical protein
MTNNNNKYKSKEYLQKQEQRKRFFIDIPLKNTLVNPKLMIAPRPVLLKRHQG